MQIQFDDMPAFEAGNGLPNGFDDDPDKAQDQLLGMTYDLLHGTVPDELLHTILADLYTSLDYMEPGPNTEPIPEIGERTTPNLLRVFFLWTREKLQAWHG